MILAKTDDAYPITDMFHIYPINIFIDKADPMLGMEPSHSVC